MKQVLAAAFAVAIPFLIGGIASESKAAEQQQKAEAAIQGQADKASQKTSEAMGTVDKKLDSMLGK